MERLAKLKIKTSVVPAGSLGAAEVQRLELLVNGILVGTVSDFGDFVSKRLMITYRTKSDKQELHFPYIVETRIDIDKLVMLALMT